jgi:hypothetical protein
MEPELKEKIAVDSHISTEQGGNLASFTSDDPAEQVKVIANKAMAVLANLPESMGGFVGEYRSQLITLGLLFGSFVSVKLTLALLGALNEIPMVQPTLELVGLGYTAWFVYRFVFRAENRSELSEKYGTLRNQVVGKK